MVGHVLRDELVPATGMDLGHGEGMVGGEGEIASLHSGANHLLKAVTCDLKAEGVCAHLCVASSSRKSVEPSNRVITPSGAWCTEQGSVGQGTETASCIICSKGMCVPFGQR